MTTQTELIIPKRIQELIDISLSYDVKCALKELLTLRPLVKELIADGERLVKFAADTAAHDWREVITMTYQGHLELVEMIAQHTALMERIKEVET